VSLLEGYVPDAEIGIEILKRKDKRFAKACELLKVGKFEEAVYLLVESGLNKDGVLFFVATVLNAELPQVEERIDAVLKQRTFIRLNKPVGARMEISDVVPADIVRGAEEHFEYPENLLHNIAI